MTKHTASTRHIIDLGVSQEGDEGPETDRLEVIIMEALMKAGFQPLFVQASEDVGLYGENAAVVLNDEETFTNLDGCSIRRLDLVQYDKGLTHADEFGETLLEF